MQSRILFGLILVALGLIIGIYSLLHIIFEVSSLENIALLILGCILMVCGTLLRYMEKIEEVEEELEEHPKSEETGSWRMQDLEYRLKKIEKMDERERKFKEEKISDKEFNKFKMLANNLLGKLDPKYVKEFKMSDNFKVYEEVMSDKEVDEKTKKRFIHVVDEMLGKLSEEEIKRFIKDVEKYALYQKVVCWSES